MIDAHVHLWQLGRNGCTWPTPDLAPIHRDFTLDNLAETIGGSGVEQAILVQSQEDAADTAWLLSIAEHPLVAGVVGWIDVALDDAPVAIGKLASNPSLRGLRPMVQDREHDWYDSAALEPAFAAMTALDLALDALVRPRHLTSLASLARRHPDLTIVIDHGAKPVPGKIDSWTEQMAALGQLPNVCCKLSGLLTELPPGAPADDVAPLFDRLWHIFGAERVIWGSDWPVLRLAGDYRSWLDQCRRLVPSIHHDAVFGSNARQTYRISQ